MAENPFVEKIASLKAGEISELIVEQNEFFQFRDAWISLPDRAEIVGEAGLNGRIIYRYQKRKNSQCKTSRNLQKVLCR